MKSIICPYCESNNVDVLYRIKKNIEPICYEYYNSIATENQSIAYIMCQCNKCNQKFKYTLGKENYITFNEPLVVTLGEDIKLYLVHKSTYDTEYRIISINSDDGEVFLIQIKGEEFPAMLTRERVSELLNNKEESKKLVRNIKIKRKTRKERK